MKVTILGAGAYALALSHIIDKNGHDITIWTKFEKERDELERKRTNEGKLKNYKISGNIKITNDLKESTKNKDLIIIAVPAKNFRETVKEMRINKRTHICIATKGIEQNTNMFMTNILKKYIHTKNYGVISGGSFAEDIVKDCPIGLTLGTKNKETEKIIKKALINKTTKLRETKDIKGTMICGSVKNVIAILSGIMHGMNMPASAISLFLTESLNDVRELVFLLGGNKKTILSFAGFGDLYLTCTSSKSRNFTLGKLIGEDYDKEHIDNYIENTTIEGLYTLKSIYDLTKKKKINVPIINLIYEIVTGKKDKNILLDFLICKE